MTIIKDDPINEYLDLADYLVNHEPLKNTYAELTYEGEKEPRIVEKDSKIIEVRLTSSLIRSLLYNLEPKEVCPFMVYHTELIRDYSTKPTLPMLKGQYFETLCLGSGAGGSATYDLPRHKKTGDKLADQLRIEIAAELFEQVCSEYDILITKENVQRKAVNEYSEEGFEDLTLYISGEVDIISHIRHPDFSHDLAVLDLKLAFDRNNKFGHYSWGKPEFLDLTQPVIYSALFKNPFAYLIFDYKPNNPGWKILPVAANSNYCSPENVQKALLREKDLKQAIKWVLGTIQMWEEEGWKKDPSNIACDRCPIKECELKHRIQEI